MDIVQYKEGGGGGGIKKEDAENEQVRVAPSQIYPCMTCMRKGYLHPPQSCCLTVHQSESSRMPEECQCVLRVCGKLGNFS